MDKKINLRTEVKRKKSQSCAWIDTVVPNRALHLPLSRMKVVSDIVVIVVFAAVISERDKSVRFSIQIGCSSTCLLFSFGVVGLRFLVFL